MPGVPAAGAGRASVYAGGGSTADQQGPGQGLLMIIHHLGMVKIHRHRQNFTSRSCVAGSLLAGR